MTTSTLAVSPASSLREIRFGDQFVVNLLERQGGEATWCLPERKAGATLIVVQQGDISGYFADIVFHCHPEQAVWIEGPVNDKPLSLVTVSPLRCVMMHMSATFLKEHPPLGTDSSSELTFQVLRCPAYRALQPLIRQMFACPWGDGYGDLFLSGKAMEMVALALHHLSECDQREMPISAATSDTERLQQVRAILMKEYRHPPGLDALAARVGANTRKLTRSFRHHYGKSIYEWLQEFRLQLAYSLLCSGDANVSSIAASVGYTPAHFCSIFRKRFGVSPRKLMHG